MKLTAGKLLFLLSVGLFKGWIEVFFWGAAIADLAWLNIGPLHVPAGVPQAKHKSLYSVQSLRQLDFNTDQ